MKITSVETLVSSVLAIFGMGVIVTWLYVEPNVSLRERLPGQDRPANIDTAVQANPADGKLVQLADLRTVNLTHPGLWPHFRGKDRDGVATEESHLARQWPVAGPKMVWSVELGEGYAGPAIWSGRVFMLDYDRAASADVLRCFTLADGKEIWRYSYPVAVKRNHGMSRTVPAVSDKYVVTLGPKCHVNCFDSQTGKHLWIIDLEKEYGSTVPEWYAGQCPLLENDRLILAPAGPDVLLMAVDCRSGKPIWKCPNPQGWKMTHSSILPMVVGGRRMYVYCGSGGVVGVAEDGEPLWETTDWKVSIATVPSPLILPDGKIFFSGGYNSGAALMEVVSTGGQFAINTLQKFKPNRFGSTQHTPILYKGYIYGVREKDKELVCLDLQGKEIWTSGAEHRFGLGPYLIADDLIYVVDDSGVLTLAEAGPRGYKQLAQAQVLQGHDSWAPLALAGGRLLVRDLARMVCLEVGKPQ